MSKSALPIHDIPVLGTGSTKHPSNEAFAAGFVIPFDKPLNFTSFDVVKYVRGHMPVKKVGHAGTLDPLATGLLLICCGRATKSIGQIHNLKKTYRADIRFGAFTPSHDAGTGIAATATYDHISREKIEELLRTNFSGTIQQVPPMYSALHRDGERLYRKARRGETVTRAPRPVTIYKTTIVRCSLPDLTLDITCGKGTYIRTIADDLGRSAGSLAYLSGLRRLSTGSFTVEHAWDPTDFRKWIEQNG